ncbi:MAG: RND transporter [SAR324 cluster bacterium]|uniref:RND transporter n=1 Tax=SAR324 cluster bacterium TaxID=2024889 RepID=A0A2A4T179_9DELT|nr:MAG: RND transporter [SAR324 cluster bacterium]
MNSKNKQQQGSIAVYTKWIIKWRYLVVLASIAVALVFASGMSRLAFTTDYRVFFAETNPFLESYEALEKVYSKNDNVLLVLAPKDKQVFSKNFLSAVEELTKESWLIPNTYRVDSLSNFQHILADEEGLVVRDLVSNAERLTPAQIEEIKKVAVNEPLLKNRMITSKADVTAISVSIRLPEDDQASQLAVGEIATHVRNLKVEFKKKYPEIDLYLTGNVMLSNAFPESSMNDMATLIPIMYLVILIITVFMLRSFLGTLATLFVIILSTITAMGAAGWMGIQLTPPSASAPTIILTLAVADSIHVLISMLQFMKNGSTRNEALIESMRINFTPVVVTSVTTAVGFLGLNFSEAPPFHDLGNMTAIGVMGALVYSLFFLPALVSILPIKVKVTADAEKQTSMLNLANWIIKHHSKILWSTVAVVIFLVAMLPRLTLNDNFVEYFDKGVEFRDDSDFTVDNLTGIYDIHFSLGAGESSGINNPEYMKKVDDFAIWLRTQPEVVNVNALTDTFKRLNKSLHDGDEQWYKLPDNRDLTAQYLLLYEMSLPLGLDLNNQINVDKSSTRVVVTLDDLSTAEMKDLKQRAEDWLRKNAPEHMFSEGTSITMMFSFITSTNAKGLLIGTIISLFFITLVLIIVLRSFKYGMLSLLPNVIPIAMAYGIWSIVDGEVGLAAATVATITLGIVVDDTVHFLAKYLRARREQGLGSHDAVRYAFSTVGKALIATSLILSSGFIILAQSTFKLNSQMGSLTTITIVLALAIDFLFLPALLIKVEGKKAEKTPSTQTVLQTKSA